jgi:type VI secretion system protein ImpA
VFEKTGSKPQLGALIRLDARGAAGLLDALHQTLSDETARLAKDRAPGAAADNGNGEPRSGGSGDISRREDVLMMIERICGYYVRVEPSSPVPLLLQRAKRLVTMDFIEIVRDLADQGLAQVGNVAGITLPGARDAQREEGD